MIPRRTFLGGTAALGAAAAARPAAAIPPVNAPYAATATLGVCGPFSGDYIKIGEEVGNGVRQACDDANRMRGSLDKIYQMQTFDDQNLLAEAIVTAGFAVDNPAVLLVIGHVGGHVTEEAAKVYNRSGMPLIVPVSSFDRITEDGLTNVLRVSVKDSVEGRLGAKYAQDAFKPKKITVFYQDGDYGYDVAAGFIQQCDADKVDTYEAAFTYDKPKFTQVATTGLKASPDCVYLAGNSGDMAQLVGELIAQGYKGAMIASQGFYNTTTLKALGKQAEDLVTSTPLPPLELAPTVFNIRSNYEQRYGPLTALAAFGYASAQIAIAAIRRTGSNDRLALLRALSLPTEYETVVGPRQFLPTGDQVDPNVYFYTVKDGKWKYRKAAHPTAFVLK